MNSHMKPLALLLALLLGGDPCEGPVLEAPPFFVAGGDAILVLSECPPNAPVLLVIGTRACGIPYKGCEIVPCLDFGPFPFAVGPRGTLVLQAVTPKDTPPNLLAIFQFVVQDPGGPKGVRVSNAVAVLTL